MVFDWHRCLDSILARPHDGDDQTIMYIAGHAHARCLPEKLVLGNVASGGNSLFHL